MRYDLLGQLTNVNYSDFILSPDVSYTFDRLGRQVTITDVLGTRTNDYDAVTLALVQEKLPDGTTLTRAQDAFGRPAGIELGSDYAVTYGYDAVGRFASVSGSVYSVQSVVSYSYLPDSDLLAGWTNSHGFGFMRSFEPGRDLIGSVVNTHSGVLIRRFDYENDAAGRRTLRRDIDLGTVLTNLFGYNARSELTSALMPAPLEAGVTNAFGYAYDAIGNREEAAHNADTTHYTANELNQYLSVTSALSAVALSYDLDGNLTNDGVRAYAWDAENRLIRVEWDTNRVDHAYDYMSRRAMKATATATNTFVYDAWNLVAEVSRQGSAVSTNYYVWGLDLSGSLQGAGGIGALLAVERSGEGAFFPSYDANGNVAAYTSTSGTLAARYDYDAYGNLLSSSGALADAFAFQFSTKYTDAETGLVYYGFRYYDPPTGRWLSRDPIGERGGLNLYVYTQNNGVNRWDLLGLNADKASDCEGRWSSFDIFAEPSGDWWLEWGSGSISWYGVGAAKICLNINIGAKGNIKCSSCCPISGLSGRVIVGPVKTICLEIEVPWTAAIGIAVIIGVPVPGTGLIAVGAIGAFAVRASQRLYQTYENLVPILRAKESFEELVKNDATIATAMCKSSN